MCTVAKWWHKQTQRLCFFSFFRFLRAPALDSELLLRCFRFFFPLECLRPLDILTVSFSPLSVFTTGSAGISFDVPGVLISSLEAPFPVIRFGDDAKTSSSSKMSYFCPEDGNALEDELITAQYSILAYGFTISK